MITLVHNDITYSLDYDKEHKKFLFTIKKMSTQTLELVEVIEVKNKKEKMTFSNLKQNLNQKFGESESLTADVCQYTTDLNTFGSVEVQELFAQMHLSGIWEQLISDVELQTLQELEILSAHGELNARNSKGKTPLVAAIEAAIEQEKYDIAHFLIKRKARVNYEEGDLDTSLVQAALKEQFKLVKCLVEAGADLNYLCKVEIKNSRAHHGIEKMIDRVVYFSNEIIDYLFSFWPVVRSYLCNHHVNQSYLNYHNYIIPKWNKIQLMTLDKNHYLYPFLEFAKQKTQAIEPIEVLMSQVLLQTAEEKLKDIVDGMVKTLKSEVPENRFYNFDEKFFNLLIGLHHKLSDPIFHREKVKKPSASKWWQFGSIFAFCSRDSAALDDVRLDQLPKKKPGVG